MVCVLKICEQQLLFMGPLPGSPGATIDIVSSDVAVVEMDSGATPSVSVCVELVDTDDGLLRDVVLLLNTVDETATGKDTIQVIDIFMWIRLLCLATKFSANTYMNIYSSLEVAIHAQLIVSFLFFLVFCLFR